MPDVRTRLDEALAHLDRDAPGPAIEALLAAWRSVRAAEIAEVLADVSRAAGQPFAAPPQIKAWHPALIERIRAHDAVGLSVLLDAFVARAETNRVAVVSSCLDELTWAPDDPRLTLPLLHLVDLPAGSSAWNKVHTRAFALLDAAGDPRAIAPLEAAAKRAAEPSDATSPAMKASLARAAKTATKLRQRSPEGVPSCPADAAKSIAALRERLQRPIATAVAAVSHSDEQQLLEAIWRDPTDDAARQVYADWLLERGDPRGEIINLQLTDTPAAKKKGERLAKTHRRALLGPLAKAVVASSAEFARGFLVACHTDVRRKAEADVIFGRPEWATVERLHFGSYAGLSAHMRALVEARGVSEAALAALATIELPRLEILAFSANASRGAGDSLAGGEPAGGLAGLATAKLPRLRVLEVGIAAREYRDGAFRDRDVSDFGWLLAAPYFEQLEELRIPLRVPLDGLSAAVLRTWLAVLEEHPRLRRLAGGNSQTEIIATKQDGRVTLAMRFPHHARDLASPPPWMMREIDQIRAALGDLEVAIT